MKHEQRSNSKKAVRRLSGQSLTRGLREEFKATRFRELACAQKFHDHRPPNRQDKKEEIYNGTRHKKYSHVHSNSCRNESTAADR
jgi:hypothetical protein